MRAAYYTQTGSADVLELGDRPLPEPGPGEVRVRMRYSGVNPSDWKMRRGGPSRPLAYPLVIPHSDGSGVIDAVGSGVPAERIGRRVWLWNGQWKRPFGTAAEAIALPAEQAVDLADEVDDETGASLGIPALTAAAAVRRAQLDEGTTALVTGGAGTVARFVIQLLKRAGIRVIATVSSSDKARIAREAGADETIDYKRDDVAERVRTLCSGGVDAIIESQMAGNAALYPKILRPHGCIAVYGTDDPEISLPAGPLMYMSASIRFLLVYELSAQERRAVLDDVESALRDGLLRPLIAEVLPLAEIRRAHTALEERAVTGNILLDVAR